MVAVSESRTFDVRRLLKIGLYGGLGYVFVASIGMIEAFNTKNVVDPILSLGYTVLLAVALVTGYRAGALAKHSEHPFPGGAIGAGLVAGLTGGAVASLYLLWINQFDVREVFTNISPALFEILTLEQGIGGGLLVALGGGAVVAALGAATTLLKPAHRKAL